MAIDKVGSNGKIASNGKAAASAAANARARLAGRPGVGTLQVWRGQHGQKLEYAGTWRRELEDGAADTDLEEFGSAFREGRALRFEGRLDDPARPEDGDVSTDVKISSISRYAYRIDPKDPASATVEVVLVNFRPVDELPGV